MPLDPILRSPSKLYYTDPNTLAEAIVAQPTANNELSIYNKIDVITSVTTPSIYLNGLQGKLEFNTANNTLKLDGNEIALTSYVDTGIANEYTKFTANNNINAGQTVALRSDGQITSVIGLGVGQELPNNFIGIAKTDIANGVEGPVYMVGDVADNQTGLTTNQIYYLEANGSLTTSETSYGLVGKALSNTSIKLLEPIVNDYKNLINKPDEQFASLEDAAFINSIIFG